MKSQIFRLVIAVLVLMGSVLQTKCLFSQNPTAKLTLPQESRQTRQAVDEKIQRLANGNFAAREAAERELWELGPSIEPILIEKELTASLEAKLRITAIRQKFAIGLTPDMPPEIQDLTRSLATEKRPDKRTAGLITLAKQGFMQPVIRLLDTSEPRERYAVVTSILESTAKQPASEKLDALLLQLIELAVTTRGDESVRLTSRIFSSSYVGNRKDDAWQKEVVNRLLKCPPENRYALYSVSMLDRPTFEKVTSDEFLPLWINFLCGEPDRSKRKRLLSRFVLLDRFASSIPGQPLINQRKHQRSQLDINETIGVLDPRSQFALLDYALESPPVVAELHDELGDEGLLKICRAAEDPSHANYVIGQLAAQTFWSKQEKENGVLAMIGRENDARLQQQIVIGYIDGLSRMSRNARVKPQQTIDALWQRISQGPPQPWHLTALLKTYNAPRVFGQKHSPESLQRIFDLAKTADAKALREFGRAPIGNRDFAAQLAQQGRLIDVLKLIRDHPSGTQASSNMTSMLRYGPFAEQFDTPKLRQALIAFCLEVRSESLRHAMASDLIANAKLLTTLIDDGHFQTILDSLIVGRDGASKTDSYYARLLGSFLSSKPVVDHLVQGNRVDLILDIQSKGISPRLLGDIVQRILRSDDAVSAILDSGRWEQLDDLIDKLDSESLQASARQTLMTRKAFADNLSRNKEVAAALKRLATDKAWLDRDLYLPLIKNLPVSVMETEPVVAMEFWNFALKLNDSDRDRCINELIGSRWFATALVKQNEWGEIAMSIGKLRSDEQIASLLKRKTTSQEIAEQISTGGLSSLLLLGDLLSDDTARVGFYRQLGDSYDLRKWLQEPGQPDLFLAALGDVANETHRGNFAFACFSSRSWDDVADHETTARKLVRFASQQPPPAATLMTVGLLSHEKLVPHVAKLDLSNCLRSDIVDAVSFAMQDVAWRRDRRHWVSLVKNLPPSSVRRQPELSWKLWRLISGNKKNPTSDTTRALLGTAWFVPQLNQQGKLQSFLTQIEQDFKSWDLRGFATQFAQGPGIIQELERGSIEVFLGLCDTMPEVEADRTTRMIGSYANVEAWFATTKQPEKIIRVFDSIKDQDRRERFAQAFLSSGILGKQPKNDTLVPQMIAYSRKHSEDFQVNVAANLLSQYATDDAAMKTDLPGFLVDRLEQENVDLDLIALMIQSRNLSGLILKKKLGRVAINRVLSAQDNARRSACIRTLLGSNTWQALLTDEDVQKIFSLTQQQGSIPLSTLIRREPYFVTRLIEMGQFDVVYRLATMRIENVDSEAQRWAFFINDAVVRHQRSSVPSAKILVDLLGDRDPAILQQRLIDVSQNGEAARWILDSYGWKPIGDAIARIPESQRRSLMPRMFLQGKLLSELAESEQFAELVSDGELRDFMVKQGGYVFLLRSDETRQRLDPKVWMELIRKGYQQSHPALQRGAKAMLGNSAVWETAIESGHGKWLLETLNEPQPNSSPKEQQERRRTNVTSSRGLLRLAIRLGEFDTAEEMLAEFIDDDLGRLRLIRFQMHRQLIAQAAGNSLELSDRFNGLLTQDRRLAAYWARSQRDIDKAIQIAKEIGDAGLVWSLVLESHDWAALRDLPVCKTKELPDPPYDGDISPHHRRIEQLGFLTMLRQISGQAETSTQQLQSWIAQQAHTPHTPRYGADALLSVGEIDAARKLLNDKLPRRLFYWDRFRLDYGGALKRLNWEATGPQKFFDQSSGQSIGTQSLRMNSAGFLIQVAMLMRDAGRAQDIAPIMNVLREHAQHPKLDQQAGTAYLRELAILIHARGFPAESRKTIALCDNSDAIRTYFQRCYDDPNVPYGTADASVWLTEFEARYPDESRLQHLNRVDGAMLATTPLGELRPFPDFDGSNISSGAASTLYRYGRFDQAAAMVKKLANPKRGDFILLGQTYLAQEKYEAAADAFFKAFQTDPNDLTRLFLAGDCWGKAGNDKKATDTKLLARCLAVEQPLNHAMAIGITQVGFESEAIDIYRTLALNSIPSRLVRMQSVRKMAIHEPNMQQKLDFATEFVLYHLRPIEYYSDLNVWLQSELDRRETQAILAIEQQRFAEAEEHWQQLFQISAADVDAANRIAKSLRDQGQIELAAEILSAHRVYLESRIEEFADSPVIKQRIQTLSK
ncbi:MAG: hypothetical protein WBD20_03890 [Pirellulaceae bacterium]